MEFTRPCHLLKISIINLFQKKRALYYKEGWKEHKTLITIETLRRIMGKETLNTVNCCKRSDRPFDEN